LYFELIFIDQELPNRHQKKAAMKSLQVVFILFSILLLFGLNSCEPLENEGGTDFVQVNVKVNQPESASGDFSYSAGSVQSAAIFAVSADFTIDTIEQITSWHDSALQSLADNTVTLIVPLNESIKLAKFTYSDSFTLEQIINGDDEPYAVGISNAFMVTGADEEVTVNISMVASESWGGTLQFGNAGEFEASIAMVMGSDDSIYIAGMAVGDLDGQTNQGPSDIFLSKFSAGGVKQWTKMFGSTGDEFMTAMAIDSNDNIYMAGNTWGGIDGQTYQSPGLGPDVFVAKYGSDGTKDWVKMFGTTSSETADGVMVGSDGKIYVAGGVTTAWPEFPGLNDGEDDLYLMRVDADGTNNTVLIQTSSTAPGDSTADVVQYAAMDDSGNIYIIGNTQGSFGTTHQGAYDAYIHKYSITGAVIWQRQFGETASDSAIRVALDSVGDVYVAGVTYNDLDTYTNQGNGDFIITKYNSSGVKQWLIQFGSAEDDSAIYEILVSSDGFVYFLGSTEGDLPANTDTTYATSDMVLGKFNASDGSQVWLKQFGTLVNDLPTGLAINKNGKLLLTGQTMGVLDGTSTADSAGDIFLMMLDTDGNIVTAF
jgi:hypothetical protein